MYNNFERPSPVSLLSSPSTIASSSFHGCVNWRGREGSFRGNESAKIYDGYKKSFAIYKRERERWTVVNLTNILRASFLPIFFWQKVKNTVSREKLPSSYKKFVRKMLMKLGLSGAKWWNFWKLHRNVGWFTGKFQKKCAYII